MAKHQETTPVRKIFDNILFLEEAFGDRPNKDIPNVPVLELARCFELSAPRTQRVSGRRQKRMAVMEIGQDELSNQRE